MKKKMVRHCDLRRRIIGSRMFLWYRCVKGRRCICSKGSSG